MNERHQCHFETDDGVVSIEMNSERFVVRVLSPADCEAIVSVAMTATENGLHFVPPPLTSAYIDHEIEVEGGQQTLRFSDYGTEEFEVPINSGAKAVLAEAALRAESRGGSAREMLAHRNRIAKWGSDSEGSAA